jgi:uncharacterized protein (TIGR02453 family)
MVSSQEAPDLKPFVRHYFAVEQKCPRSVRMGAQIYTGRCDVSDRAGIFPSEIFKFFRELARNNHKPWMDANRERYRTVVVEPCRVLFDRLSPAALKLNPRFLTTGRVGDNFSRINRDIRFARDKSPYRSQMYLFFSDADGEAGQLYVGVSAEAVTTGFRIYGGSKTSSLAKLARPRGKESPKWIEQQKRHLGKKYESYWYSSEKGEWAKHPGWPVNPENWRKLQGWIVRRKQAPAAATRNGFEREIVKAFRDLYSLYRFTSSPDWKS